MRHIFLILIGILFYCGVISFKETRKYGKRLKHGGRAAPSVSKRAILEIIT